MIISILITIITIISIISIIISTIIIITISIIILIIIDDLLASGWKVMGVQKKRARELLTVGTLISFYKATATRPALLVLDNRKPLAKLSEQEVS